MIQDTPDLEGDEPGGGDPAKCILALTTSGLGARPGRGSFEYQVCCPHSWVTVTVTHGY